MLPFLLFGFFVVLAIVAIVVSNKVEKERLAKLSAFAMQQGWSFDPEKRRDAEERFPEFDLFRRGSNRYRQTVMAGNAGGHRAEIFDYHYETTSGTGKDRRTTHHRFCVAELRPPFPLRPMAVREEGFLDKIASAFGWNDLDFESGEFSRRFHVSAEDRKWAYDALPPRSMELLLSRPSFTLQTTQNSALIFASGTLSPEKSLEIIQTCGGFLDGIPAFAREANAAP